MIRYASVYGHSDFIDDDPEGVTIHIGYRPAKDERTGLEGYQVCTDNGKLIDDHIMTEAECKNFIRITFENYDTYIGPCEKEITK